MSESGRSLRRMTANDILIDLARRPMQSAEALRPLLTPGLLNAHPHHPNSIAWLLWHAAREIDEQLAVISGETPLWITEGFNERFALEVEANEIGYGHTPEQARAVVVTDPDLLLEHLTAVTDALVAFISRLDDAELGRIVDDSWDPPVTLAVRLVSMASDASEHVGQAAYIAGMGERAFEPGGSPSKS